MIYLIEMINVIFQFYLLSYICYYCTQYLIIIFSNQFVIQFTFSYYNVLFKLLFGINKLFYWFLCGINKIYHYQFVYKFINGVFYYFQYLFKQCDFHYVAI